MIYLIEGADGTGKSTLARAIAEKTKASVLHCSFKPEWDLQEYHHGMIQVAKALDDLGNEVILDRWSPSGYVYGTVFQGGSPYNIVKFMDNYKDDIVWIYCENENVVENHNKNKLTRKEMFDDMSKVPEAYERLLATTKGYNWKRFDFNKTTLEKFLKEELCLD
jgi:thymidylate kinase